MPSNFGQRICSGAAHASGSRKHQSTSKALEALALSHLSLLSETPSKVMRLRPEDRTLRAQDNDCESTGYIRILKYIEIRQKNLGLLDIYETRHWIWASGSSGQRSRNEPGLSRLHGSHDASYQYFEGRLQTTRDRMDQGLQGEKTKRRI